MCVFFASPCFKSKGCWYLCEDLLWRTAGLLEQPQQFFSPFCPGGTFIKWLMCVCVLPAGHIAKEVADVLPCCISNLRPSGLFLWETICTYSGCASCRQSDAKINHLAFRARRAAWPEGKRKEEALAKAINLLALDAGLTKCLTAPGTSSLFAFLSDANGKSKHRMSASMREKNLELSSVVWSALFCYVELPSKTLSGSNFQFHLPACPPGASCGSREWVRANTLDGA